MATYCDCGHVLMEHCGPLDDDDGSPLSFGECLGDGGFCLCEAFEAVEAAELERGYD